MAAFFDAKSPGHVFLDNLELNNIFQQWAPIALMAAGETYVIISGGIDLSVGGVAGFAGVVAAIVMRSMTTAGHGQTITLVVGTLVTMGVGIAVGLVNAGLMIWARLVPFIATLATMGACEGLSIVLSGGGPVVGGPPDAVSLVAPKFGPFSYPVLIVTALVIILGLFLHLARFGRYTFAIGSNSFAARAAGIAVNRHLVKVYVLSGLLAGLAGMFYYLILDSGAPTSGNGDELRAIAAVVIGGAALTGGYGRLTGTMLGALLITTVTSGLIIINVAPNWNQVVVAIMIAAAATLQALRPAVRRGS